MEKTEEPPHLLQKSKTVLYKAQLPIHILSKPENDL